MTTGIYGIFSTEDSSCLYVGQSKNIEARFKHHLRNLKGKHVSALPSFVEWFHGNNADKSVFYMKILEKIAALENVSRQTVFNKLKQFEIPRRGNNDRWKT